VTVNENAEWQRRARRPRHTPSQEDCLALCLNNSLPAGCAHPEGYRCEYAAWSDEGLTPPLLLEEFSPE
jgi:hypothetical protein